jgi:hypothetical protein
MCTEEEGRRSGRLTDGLFAGCCVCIRRLAVVPVPCSLLLASLRLISNISVVAFYFWLQQPFVHAAAAGKHLKHFFPAVTELAGKSSRAPSPPSSSPRSTAPLPFVLPVPIPSGAPRYSFEVISLPGACVSTTAFAPAGKNPAWQTAQAPSSLLQDHSIVIVGYIASQTVGRHE